MKNCICLLGILWAQWAWSQNPTKQVLPVKDSLVQFNFNSLNIGQRTITLWLPAATNANEKLAVVYMHDGQMLFDSTNTWNKQEWKVDETLNALFKDSNLTRCMVVGIWNNGSLRHYEYSPQQAIEKYLSATEQAQLMQQLHESKKTSNENKQQLLGDDYLKFIVEELKPYIDQHYHTYPDAAHTSIMGSSMGGLISFYGLCQYPQIFGNALCLSTHWPGLYVLKNNLFQKAILSYAKANIPRLPASAKFYFDRGTTTLDSLYEFGQGQIDQLLQKHLQAQQYQSLVFEGANHTEKAWAARLAIPFQFALKKKN